jgi:hypothetical protein
MYAPAIKISITETFLRGTNLCPRIQWDKEHLTPINWSWYRRKRRLERWRIHRSFFSFCQMVCLLRRLCGRFGGNVSSNSSSSSVGVVVVTVKRRVCGAYCCCCCLLRVTNATLLPHSNDLRATPEESIVMGLACSSKGNCLLYNSTSTTKPTDDRCNVVGGRRHSPDSTNSDNLFRLRKKNKMMRWRCDDVVCDYFPQWHISRRCFTLLSLARR